MSTFDLNTTKQKPLLQPKLAVGQPDDKYEQEADRMAEQVMRMPEGEAVQRNCTECEDDSLQMKPLAEAITPVVQREAIENEEELRMKPEPDILQRQSGKSAFADVSVDKEDEELVQAKSTNEKMTAPPFLESRLTGKKGQGQTLPKTTQQSMSRAFGADFSRVRVHTDQDAVQMNRELGAKAFTHGGDVYFNQGEYSPESGEGKRLLGHELTHVVQQDVFGYGMIQKEILETEEFEANEKLQNVYQNLKHSAAMENILRQFSGEKPMLHLKFHVVSDIPEAKAHTMRIGYSVIIEFDKGFVDKASEISIAKTFMHELIHASHKLDWVKAGEKLSRDEFPGIYDYMERYKDKEGGDWKHNLMAEHSRGQIISGLQEYDDSTGIKPIERSGTIYVGELDKTVPYSKSDFYEALSWGGLMGKAYEDTDGKKKWLKTTSWAAFEKENPEKAALYLAIMKDQDKEAEIPINLLEEVIVKP